MKEASEAERNDHARPPPDKTPRQQNRCTWLRSHPVSQTRREVTDPSFVGSTFEMQAVDQPRPNPQYAVDYATHPSLLFKVSHSSPIASPRSLIQSFFASLAFLLACMSPSASHLLAFTNCTTLMICLPNMTGKDVPARIHGTVLSSLFALHRRMLISS
jgi:hypothetical protein